MAAKIWPAFMLEPEYARELEAEEWADLCEMWEARDAHNENVRLGFEEDAA